MLKFGQDTPWWQALKLKVQQNKEKTQVLISDRSLPMNYYTAFDEVSIQYEYYN